MVLESQRLLLLSPEQVSAQALVDYFTRNRAFLEPFEPARPPEYYTPAHQQGLLQAQRDAWSAKTGYRLYLALKEQPESLIGFVSFSGIIMGAFCSCYLSYQLDQNHLNRGLMTEGVLAAVGFGFDTLGLHRIEANIMPRNLPSRRVAEKCGFLNEGTSPKYLKICGKWEDHIHYVILNHAME